MLEKADEAVLEAALAQSDASSQCIEYKCRLQRVGIAADGRGQDLKNQLAIALEIAGLW
jgi:hypothetical protein